MKFVVYDKSGKILRTGHCQDRAFHRQTEKDEFIMVGTANDVRQKVVKGKIVDKTLEEIRRDNPRRPEIPTEKRRAFITNEQIDDILQRLGILEDKQIL